MLDQLNQSPALPTTIEQARALARGGQYCYLSQFENKDGYKCANNLYQTDVSYRFLVESALEDIAKLTARDVMARCRHCDTEKTAQDAIDQQKASWERSLQRLNDGTIQSPYDEIRPGIYTNKNNPGQIYIKGLMVKSEPVWVKERPAKQSKPLPATKAWIRFQSRISDYRKFSLTPDSNFEYLAMAGMVITPKDVADFLKTVEDEEGS